MQRLRVGEVPGFDSQAVHEEVDMEIDEKKLTRVVLVDYRDDRSHTYPLVYEQWDLSVDLSVQDDGRTLKVFVR